MLIPPQLQSEKQVITLHGLFGNKQRCCWTQNKQLIARFSFTVKPPICTELSKENQTGNIHYKLKQIIEQVIGSKVINYWRRRRRDDASLRNGLPVEGDTDKGTIDFGDLRLHLKLILLGHCQAGSMLVVVRICIGGGVEVRRWKGRLRWFHGFEVPIERERESRRRSFKLVASLLASMRALWLLWESEPTERSVAVLG